MTTHEVKIHPEYFRAVKEGRKTFEYRYNDRDYQVGDTVILNEYDPSKEVFTGNYIKTIISYILRGESLPDKMIIFSIKILNK